MSCVKGFHCLKQFKIAKNVSVLTHLFSFLRRKGTPHLLKKCKILSFIADVTII